VDGPTPPPFVVCCDLDGVVWRGETPIEPAVAGIAELRASGLRVAFVTNNSSQRLSEVADRLARAGVPAEPDDIVTSASAAAALLASSLTPNARVLACAGAGVVEAMEREGFAIVDGPPADAVVVGFHRDFDFDELVRVSQAVREGARFIATNVDATYPITGGLLPGAGSIVAAVATASGREPEVAGKPEAPMAAIIRARLGDAGIVVGDRPSSDGAFAAALGWPFALVLSGIASRTPGHGEERVPDPPPAFVGADLGALVPDLLRTVAARSGA
jgi:glycerol 3-phosphatase-2